MYGCLEKLKEVAAMVLTDVFQCLPVKRNKIFMMSYYGRGYDCNPKYLTEYLLSNKKQYNWEIVWAFNDIKAHDDLKGIRKVHMMSFRYFYELCTAKVIITNFRMTKHFKKRKQQYYIQTWHSSLRLKKIEKDAEGALTAKYIEMAKADSKQCDLLISGCELSTEIFKRAFWYEGEILECGTPRNDYLLNHTDKGIEKIKQKLKVPEEKKIILYAPTFRKNHDLGVYDLEYKKLQELLSKRWGSEWMVFVRLHPHLDSEALNINWSDTIRDVSKWEDIQELLLVSDLLISDYSSLIFDYRFTKRPCFLYVPDLEQYIANDRSLYFDICKLPFEMAVSQEDLSSKIEHFDNRQYGEKLQLFENQVGSFEVGRACERLAEHIAQIMHK